MSDKPERWYNSRIATGIGAGLLFMGIGYAFSSYLKGCSDLMTQNKKIDQCYELQVADLNGNGIPDKFYSIDGKIALIELDGVTIPLLLEKHKK